MSTMPPHWHALPYDQAAAQLDSADTGGLSSSEALARLERYGENHLKAEGEITWLRMLGRQFSNLLIIILALAAGISFFVGEVIDALAIFAIIVLNGLLGFIQEWKAETALKQLQKMVSPQCRVLRDGKVKLIDATGLVPGDRVVLEAGDSVPADLRLYDAINLKIDEAALTGESAPVSKSIDDLPDNTSLDSRTNMAWMGTNIINGHGEGLVVATGMETEFGRIADLTGTIQETATRLQRNLSQLARQLAVITIAVAIAVFVIGSLTGKDLLEMFMTAVSLAVAAVPEGLPAVVTITLALGVRMMAKRKALMRHLQAAETLGATSVICTDKTGTLTKNEMTVQKIYLGNGQELSVSGVGYTPDGAIEKNSVPVDIDAMPGLAALLDCGRKCNHARLSEQNGLWSILGSATEAALLVLAEKGGFPQIHGANITAEYSFNSTRKRMSVIEDVGGHYMVHVKGAPEILLERASKILVDGKEEALDEERRKDLKDAYTRYAQNGLRTLALARKTLSPKETLNEDTAETELVFLGIVGVIDPPRPEVRPALEKTQAAGIHVVMVTGDSPDTALAIARQLGMNAQKAITGRELENMTDEAILEAIHGGAVFARTVPEDKYRLVKLLQQGDHLVAMTGDGVNDAPALKQADVGIAMGIRGTDVAKGAADMVLTDDNFATIVNAIEEGRRQYANIRKFVYSLLSSNFGEIIAIFLNILMGLPLILLPVQILWVNLVTDGITAIALGIERAEKDVMQQPPRPVNDPILSRGGTAMLILIGGYTGIVVLGLFVYYLGDHESGTQAYAHAHANAIAFTLLVMLELINVLNFRSLRGPISRIGWFSNPWLLISMTVMLLFQIAAIYLPFMHDLLHVKPLSLQDWGIIAAFTLPLFIVPELYKALFLKHKY